MCKRINEDWVEPTDVQIIKNTNGSNNFDTPYNMHYAWHSEPTEEEPLAQRTHFQFAREMIEKSCLESNQTCGCANGYEMVLSCSRFKYL